jgi:hypothetical protein
LGSKDCGAFSNRSTKDKTVSHSSTESEVKAVDEVVREIEWQVLLLEELGYTQRSTLIREDNLSTIAIVQKLKFHDKTKHLNKRINYIHQQLEGKFIHFEHCPSRDMVADIHTKPLELKDFLRLRLQLMGTQPPQH